MSLYIKTILFIYLAIFFNYLFLVTFGKIVADVAFVNG